VLTMVDDDCNIPIALSRLMSERWREVRARNQVEIDDSMAHAEDAAHDPIR
jgi:hypothetical protein